MSIKIAHAVRASAATFAAKAAGNDAMQEYTHSILQKKDEVAQGPLYLSVMLEGIFGDEMSATPTPGTEEKDVGDNQLPDVYTLPETVDGKIRDVTGSWIKDFVHGQPEYQVIAANKAGLKLAQKQDKDTPAEWANLSGNKPECEGWLSYWQGKDTALVNLYRRAFALWHKIAAVNACAGLAVETLTDEEGNLTDSSAALRLTDESDHKDARAHIKDMTIASFERLDLSRLDDPTWMDKAGGNQYMALMATTNRGARDGKPNKIKIENTRDFDDALASLAGWLNDNSTSAYAKVLAEVSKKPEDSDDLISSIGRVNDFLDSIMAKEKVRNRYNALTAAKANRVEPVTVVEPETVKPAAPVVVPPTPAVKPAVVVGKGNGNGKRRTA